LNKEQLIKYITEKYNTDKEYPWIKYPNYVVFRHQENRKWFALIMDIPQNKLGLAGNEIIDVLNVKCDPIIISSLREESGVYPAYHMNKASWITIALDGSVDNEKIKWLIDMSFELTSIKKKRSKGE